MLVNLKLESEGYLHMVGLVSFQVSFMNDSVLKQHAAELLQKTKPCPFQVHAGGDHFCFGNHHQECSIGGWGLAQDFVIAPAVELILLGLDFIVAQKASWDWEKGAIEFQDAPKNAAYTCLLT